MTTREKRPARHRAETSLTPNDLDRLDAIAARRHRGNRAQALEAAALAYIDAHPVAA